MMRRFLLNVRHHYSLCLLTLLIFPSQKFNQYRCHHGESQETTYVLNTYLNIRPQTRAPQNDFLIPVILLDHCRYLVNLSFYGLDAVDKHFNIEDINFVFETFNPQFTRMELWFRFFFATVTAVVAVGFLSSLRGFALDDWSIEQKWVCKTSENCIKGFSLQF